MRLYHGTSSIHLDAIIRDGILPRTSTGEEGNWKGGWQSKPEFVYLSTVYPVYYASEATVGGGEMAIIEVDYTKVGRLYPDDEFIARIVSAPSTHGSVEAALPGSDPTQFQWLWRSSLEHFGTVCCSSVPTHAIVRHRVLPADAALWSWLGGDALPSPANFQACGNEYAELIQLFMDEGLKAVTRRVDQHEADLDELVRRVQAETPTED